jgi:hypothetical protein
MNPKRKRKGSKSWMLARMKLKNFKSHENFEKNCWKQNTRTLMSFGRNFLLWHGENNAERKMIFGFIFRRSRKQIDFQLYL